MLVETSDAISVATQQLTSIFWRREANCALFWRSIVWPTPPRFLRLLRAALSHENSLNCAETQHSCREAHEEHAVVYGFDDHRTNSAEQPNFKRATSRRSPCDNARARRRGRGATRAPRFIASAADALHRTVLPTSSVSATTEQRTVVHAEVGDGPRDAGRDARPVV
jgi:hypothetical protein